AAEAIAQLRGPDGWPLAPLHNGNDLRRRVTHKAQAIPLPRPRPDALEKASAIQGDAMNPVAAAPLAAPMPPATPLAAPGPQNASTPRSESALPCATEQGAEPVGGNGGAAMPPVSISDACGGMVRIEAHDASVGQVLAALQ